MLKILNYVRCVVHSCNLHVFPVQICVKHDYPYCQQYSALNIAVTSDILKPYCVRFSNFQFHPINWLRKVSAVLPIRGKPWRSPSKPDGIYSTYWHTFFYATAILFIYPYLSIRLVSISSPLEARFDVGQFE